MAFNGELFEIFSWLPAKTLYKFSSVAKPCLDFLSEPYFAEKQCTKSLSKPEDCLFLQDNSILRYKPDFLQLRTFSKDTSSNGVHGNSLEFLRRRGRILASSNGLLLCRTIDSTKPTKLFLFNPATTTWLDIDLPNEMLEDYHYNKQDFSVVFTCGDSSFGNNKSFPFDYTLLLIDPDYSKEWSDEFNVYISEEGKWVMKEKNLITGGRSLNLYNPVCCKGGLYFISDCGDYIHQWASCYWPYILCYDIHYGTSNILPMPDEARENFKDANMNIFGWRKKSDASSFDSICLVKSISSIIWVWVLEDIKDPSSWRRLLKVDINKDMEIKDCITFRISFIVTGNNLVFTTDRYVYKYVLEGKDGGEVQVICRNTCKPKDEMLIHSYSSTLRPCKINKFKRQRLIK